MGHGVLRNGDDNVFFQRGDVNKNRVLIFIRVLHMCVLYFFLVLFFARVYIYYFELCASKLYSSLQTQQNVATRFCSSLQHSPHHFLLF